MYWLCHIISIHFWSTSRVLNPLNKVCPCFVSDVFHEVEYCNGGDSSDWVDGCLIVGVKHVVVDIQDFSDIGFGKKSNGFEDVDGGQEFSLVQVAIHVSIGALIDSLDSLSHFLNCLRVLKDLLGLIRSDDAIII